MTIPEHVTHTPDGFDELYLENVHAHLERLDDGSAYLHLWADAKTVHLDFAADKGRLVVTVNLCEGVAEEETA